MDTALEVAKMQVKGVSAREAFEAVKDEIAIPKNASKNLEEEFKVALMFRSTHLSEKCRGGCLPHGPSDSIQEKSRAAFTAF